MTRHWFRRKDGRARAVGTLFDDAVVMLEDRVMLDAVPTATFTATSQVVPLTNPDGSFSATVRFDNANSATDTGYGPFIQLIVPTRGADGPSVPDGITNDGVTFTGASYLGNTLSGGDVFDLTFQSVSGVVQATNPLTNAVVLASDYGAQAGDHMVVLRLPFGSFTVPQTAADIQVDFTLSRFADLSTPLNLKAIGGFQYGTSPTGNTPVVQLPGAASIDAISASIVTGSVTTDTEANTSQEVATGPNQAYNYFLNIDVATGQTITDRASLAQGPTLTSTLPDTLVYQGINSVTVGGVALTEGVGYTIVAEPTEDAVVISADNQLSIKFTNPITGAVGNDIVISYNAYVNNVHGAGGAVLTQGSNFAATNTSTDMSLSYNWSALDPRDRAAPSETLFSPQVGADNTVINRPIAIQKSNTFIDNDGSGNFSPSDTVVYTLQIQVSDYFAVGDISISDVLSDGQRLDTSFIPTIAVTQRGVTSGTQNFAGIGVAGGEFTGNFASTFNVRADGQTDNVINVSAALAANGIDADGVLMGGRVAGQADAAGTILTVVFHATVQNSFVGPVAPGATIAVDQGDSVGNSAQIASSIRDPLTPGTTIGATTTRDDATTSRGIVTGGLTKEIVAINGVAPAPGEVRIKAGDTVTYRLRYALPISSFENLNFTDYLPLPIFQVVPGFSLTADVDGGFPEANEFGFGAGNTFVSGTFTGANTTPTITYSDNTSGNSIKFDFGSYSAQENGIANQSSVIDLLFTVVATDTAFTDGLYLTNLASSSENNTAGVPSPLNSIVQVRLSQPKVSIQKAIVAVGAGNGNITTAEAIAGFAFNPVGDAAGFTGTVDDTALGATPLTKAAPNINSNLAGADAGDTARVALVINNEGSGPNGAFDVGVLDALPAGVGLIGTGNFTLAYGDGTALNDGSGIPPADYTITYYTDAAGTAATANPALAVSFRIAFNDVAGASLKTDGAGNGRDIIIVTYDVSLGNGVAITPTALTSDASVTSYAALDGGVNQVTSPISDDATISLLQPGVVKTLVSTDDPATAGFAVTPGELATYTVTYTFPEGTTSAVRLADILPGSATAGRYEIVSATITSVGNRLTTSLAVNDVGVLSNTNGAGADGTYNDTATFGGGAGVTVTNAFDNDPSNVTGNQIVVTYVVRAVADAQNDVGSGVNRDAGSNTGRLTYGPGNSVVEGYSAIALALPQLSVTKTLTTAQPIDASDTVTFVIDVRHAAASTASAYDLNFSDLVPTGLTPLTARILVPADTNTTLTDANFEISGQTVRFVAGTQDRFDFANGDFFRLTVTASVSAAAQAGATYTNTANVTYSTANNGNVTPGTNIDGERVGILASGSDSVTIPVILTKSFSPNPATPITSNQAVIGSTISYYIIATLPEGVSNAFTIRDIIAAGLTPVSATVVSIGGVTTLNATSGGNIAGSSLGVGASGSIAGQTVTFVFGDLTDAIDPAAQGAGDRIVVQINARITDEALTRSSPPLLNTGAQRTVVDGTPTAFSPSNTVTTAIADPEVTITKQVLVAPATYAASATVQASGDTVEFRSVISATAGANFANAQDVVFTDLLGDGATLSGGAVVIDGTSVNVGGTTVIGGVTVSVVSANGGNGFLIRFGEMVTGTSHTIDYRAAITSGATTTVGDDVNLGRATVTYDSISSTAGGIAQSGVGDGQGDKDQSASASATVGVIGIAKAITATADANTGTAQVRAGVTDLNIGETATVQLTISAPAGARTFTVADLLDLAGIGRVAAGVPTITPGAGVSFATAPVVTSPDLDGDGNPDLNIAFSMAGGSAAGTITITYTATAANVAGNASGDQIDLPVTLTYASAPPAGIAGTQTASISVDLVEPALTIAKDVAVVGTPDAGDVVTYTIVVTNTGNGPAYDVALSDPLPPGLTYVAATASLTLSAGGGTTNPADPTSVTIPTLLPGQTATLVFNALIGNAVVTAATVTNTASVSADSLPGVASGRGVGPVTDPASFTTGGAQALSKSIAATADANTGTAAFRAGIGDLTIGEVATIDLRIDFTEGTTTGVVISDLLTSAAGTLTYVPGSAILQTANGVTISGSLTPALVDDNADGVPDRVVFTLGNVTIPGDVSGANNFFVIRYQAAPADRPENAAGDAIDLTATLTSALGSTTSAISVDLVEPVLVIDKSITTSDPIPNAGDTVGYQIVVTNNGTGPAYNVLISDPIPAGLTLVGGTSQLILSMGGGTTNPANPQSVTIPTLMPGQSATLSYSVTIDNTAVTGVPITNTATIGGSGSTPGGGGRQGPNPSDNTSFTVEANQGLSKAISATGDANTGTGAFRPGVTDLGIGETATIDLTVRLTEGTTASVVLVDKLQLPAGTMTLTAPPTIVTANGVTFTGSGAAGYTLTDTDGDGTADTITMDFGTVTVPGNNDASDNFFVIRYTALLGDRPENQVGDQIDLGATLTTALGTAAAATAIDVVAPAVTLTKAAAAGFVSRGDAVSYTITLTNAGTGPAYDLSLADVLPAGLSYVAGTTALTVGGVTTAFASPNAVTLAMLGSGQTAVVSYQVLVDPAVAAAANYTNTATVSFDSLSGVGGRPGNASGTATIATPTNVIGLSKSYVSTTLPETGTAQFRPGVTDLNVGERATIDLTASFTEGATGTVVLTDQLPLTGKFQIVGTPTVTYLGGTTSTVPGTLTLTDTDGDGLADRLTFSFGTVTVPVDGNPTNNLIRIRYEVIVPDVATNVPGAALASPAMLTTAAGNAAASIAADIVAPNVGITKAVSAGAADAGDVKTYTVTITNNGTGPAFDLTIADALPPGLSAVAGTTVLTIGGVSINFASPNAVPLASLGVGQSAVLTFNAVVGDAVVGGSTLTNSATVSYDSLPGAGGHTGGATATAGFATAAVQTLDKAVVATSETFTGVQFVRPGATDLTIGERATFELTTTFSEGTTNNVVITDQLITAAGVLTFTGTPTLVLGSGITITGSVTPTFVDTNGDGVPDQVRFTLGNVTVPGDNNAANNVIRIRYDAVLSNVAANVAGNQLTLPATLTSSTGSLTDSEPVDIVAPVLTLSKALDPNQPSDGQTTLFLLTIGHATTSTASATNIALTEILPPGALLAGATVVSGPAGITINGNVITIPQLDLGQTVVVRIATSVDFANPPSGDTVNRAGIAYGTLTGTTPGGRSGVADAQAILPFGNPTTTLPGMLARQEMNEIGSMGSYLDARYIEDFPEIDPVYSGSATPGTFISIDVSDDAGSASGFGTATADAGGNWLIRLPSTTMSDRIERSRFDHYYDGSRLFRSPNANLFDDRGLLGFNRMGDRLAVGSKPSFATQIVRINVAGQAGGFDTSFAPNWRDQFFSVEPGLSMQGVFRDRAGEAVENLYEGLASPEAAGLNRFNREFLTTADF